MTRPIRRITAVLAALAALATDATAGPPEPTAPLGPAARTTVSAAGGSGPAEIGRPHPALELDALDGSVITGPRLAQRPFIVAFFASWCQPCHRAHADLIDARREVAPDAQLVFVDLGESPDDVRAWSTHTKLPDDALVGLDPRGVAARRWGSRRLPTTFIVDAGGVVRHINRGWGPGYGARLRRWLSTLGKAAGSPTGPTAPAPSPAP